MYILFMFTSPPPQTPLRSVSSACGLLAQRISVGQKVQLCPREPAHQGNAETRDRTGDLQIFSLTLSQLSYRGSCAIKKVQRHWTYADKLEAQFRVESFTSARVA